MMNGNRKKLERIKKLPPFASSVWEEVESAFRNVDVLEFGQAWHGQAQSAFRRGEVRLGWQEDRLLYFAELHDEDIFSKATQRNEPLWRLGDVLELFAGIQDQATYVEYHAAPNGQILQLFWPDAEAVKNIKAPGQLTKFLVEDDRAKSQVRILDRRWQVYGEFPRTSLRVESRELQGEIWEISFGRYDFYRDGSYVLSNTSPLTIPAYHQRSNWRQFQFC